MDLQKKPLLETIGYIELFIDKENQCPFQYIETLVSRIKPCLRAIQLSKIGGESIIIRAKNSETNNVECLKIARLKIQDPNCPALKQDNKNVAVVVSTGSKDGFFWSMKKKEEKELTESKNTKIARFMRGCSLHQDIIRYVMKDKPDFKIPMVYDFSTQPLVYLRQEWLINTSMLQKIKTTKSLFQRLVFFVKLLNAIDYIHSYGFIHRDIKIDNLMWDGAKSVVLLDWTMAKDTNQTSKLTVAGTKGGTPGIAPPKLISDGDFGEANFLDDIFMLGACLWEFVNAENFPSLREKASDIEHQAHREKQLALLPDALQGIFWKATELEESNRYPTIVAMKNAVIKSLEFFKDDTAEEKKESKKIAVSDNDSIVLLEINDKNFCENCKDRMNICSKYELCKKQILAMQELRKDGYL